MINVKSTKKTLSFIKKNSNIFYLLLTIIISVFMIIELEHSYTRLNALSAMIVLKNAVIVMFINACFDLICYKHGVSLMISCSILNILSVIDHYVSKFHGEPFLPMDIADILTAKNVIESYSLILDKTVIKMLICYAVAMALSFLLFKIEEGKKLKIKLIEFAFYFIVFLCIMFAFPSNEGDAKTWSWYYSISQNGYLYEFTRATFEMVQGNYVYKPDGYSVEKVIDIVNGTTVEKDASFVENKDYPDVIIILNESWYDLSLVTDLNAYPDYMEHYSKLNCVNKGYAIVPSIGGGTNRSEYELLTSNSLSIMKSGIIPYSWLDLMNSTNVVKYFKNLGYTTLAAHTEDGSNYSRKKSWKKMGFDFCKFGDDFPSKGRGYGKRVYTSDSCAFKDFEKMMEELPDGKPRFGFLLTIQNHGDYDMNDPEYDIVKAKADYLENDSKVDEYLTMIMKTDESIDELIDYYRKSSRKVIIAMVGDHAPSFVNDVADDSSEENMEIKKKSTPFFIWSNFGDNSSVNREYTIDLSNLTPLILKDANLPLTPYYDVCNKLADAGVINSLSSLNECVTITGTEKEKEKVEELFRNYLYMEYNNAADGKNIVESAFTPRIE